MKVLLSGSGGLIGAGPGRRPRGGRPPGGAPRLGPPGRAPGAGAGPLGPGRRAASTRASSGPPGPTTPWSTWPAPASATTAGPRPGAGRSGQPGGRHRPVGGALAGLDPAPGRAGQRLGRRLLRRPGRRGARPRTAPPGSGSWPSSAGPGRRPRPRRPPAMRVVPLRVGVVLSHQGRGAGQAAPAVQAGPRRAARLRAPVPELDHPRRRGGGDPPGPRRRSLAGPVNATAPNPVTNAEFTAGPRPGPAPAGGPGGPRAGPRLALGGQMAAEMLLGGQRVLPRPLEAVGHPFAHPELDGALAALLGHRSLSPAGRPTGPCAGPLPGAGSGAGRRGARAGRAPGGGRRSAPADAGPPPPRTGRPSCW